MCSLASENLEQRRLGGNKVFLDYLAGESSILQFYSHSPLDFQNAFDSRRAGNYPRAKLAAALLRYNKNIGGSAKTIENIQALLDGSNMCVVSGQQAGFLGGPLYTFYKIVTTIRLARMLTQRFHVKVVPVFWLASEDHDFSEINFAYYRNPEDRLARASFTWDQRGNSISDLLLTPEVKKAVQTYYNSCRTGIGYRESKSLFSFSNGDTYCSWCARIWTRLFTSHGLIIVEPEVIRAASPDFFRKALTLQDHISSILQQTVNELDTHGYQPSLSGENTGCLYTYDSHGRRVRVSSGLRTRVQEGAQTSFDPGIFSTDVVLRPLLQDSVFPVMASVLGPGEIAYQSVMKPLYDLFGITQPLLFPRKSYTLVDQELENTARIFKVPASHVVAGTVDPYTVCDRLVPDEEHRIFETAKQAVERHMMPLREHVKKIDPLLGRSWQGTLSTVEFRLQKLKKRANNAYLAKNGYSNKQVSQLFTFLKPKQQLQERVLPLPYAINTLGASFVDRIFSAGDLVDFSHHVLTWRTERGTDNTTGGMRSDERKDTNESR